MRFTTLATDFDGTIASEGVVDSTTTAALRRAREAGLRIILVTGRELGDLFNTFDQTQLFERIVAENGAVVCSPESGSVELLAAPADPSLINRLTADGVPISVGHCILATVDPHEPVVERAIRELKVPYDITRNKEAVMILPKAVSKATGLRAALTALQLDPLQVVAIGDAENDIALLQACGLRAAVNNALPPVQAIAHLVTQGVRGDGVIELIERLLSGEFDAWRPEPAG